MEEGVLWDEEGMELISSKAQREYTGSYEISLNRGKKWMIRIHVVSMYHVYIYFANVGKILHSFIKNFSIQFFLKILVTFFLFHNPQL